jgi:hypothetical protein
MRSTATSIWRWAKYLSAASESGRMTAISTVTEQSQRFFHEGLLQIAPKKTTNQCFTLSETIGPPKRPETCPGFTLRPSNFVGISVTGRSDQAAAATQASDSKTGDDSKRTQVYVSVTAGVAVGSKPGTGWFKCSHLGHIRKRNGVFGKKDRERT